MQDSFRLNHFMRVQNPIIIVNLSITKALCVVVGMLVAGEERVMAAGYKNHEVRSVIAST